MSSEQAVGLGLVGALCAEQHDEWSTGRKYLTMDEYFQWKADLSEVETTSGVKEQLPKAT